MVRIKFHHTDVELWWTYQVGTCAVERCRLHVLALLAGGRTRAEVLAITRYRVPRYVGLVHRYNG